MESGIRATAAVLSPPQPGAHVSRFGHFGKKVIRRGGNATKKINSILQIFIALTQCLNRRKVRLLEGEENFKLMNVYKFFIRDFF